MRLRHTLELSSVRRERLFDFLVEAFAGDFDADDLDHALGGVHAVVEGEGGLLGHAAVVQRRVMVGEASATARVLRAGYVEAVAVAPHARRRGIGDLLMTRVDRIVDQAFDIGLLSASEAGRPLYLRHGWKPWSGALGALTPTGPEPTPDDQGCVLARFPRSAAPVDLSSPLYCDWRPGALW